MNKLSSSCGRKPLLTIAIPTYNRASALKAQLELLMPQLTDEVVVLIYDNASQDGTPTVAAPYLSDRVFYYCATTNGGAGRNFLRCFEESQTEWLWMLSDDDPITDTAVQDLLCLLKGCQADFVHTSSLIGVYEANVTFRDFKDFLASVNLSSLLWISTGVYRLPAFRPLLGLFVESIATWGPQMLIVLALLERQMGQTFITSTRLITKAPEVMRWSTLSFIIRFSTAPEFLQKPDNQRLLAQRIWDYYPWALLMGLREIQGIQAIERWQRIRKTAKAHLKSYGARSPLWETSTTWFRTGKRRSSLQFIYHYYILSVLTWCPSRFFPAVLKWLPKPKWVVDLLGKNNKNNYIPE